jgi:hypothetical protein
MAVVFRAKAADPETEESPCAADGERAYGAIGLA